MFFLLLSLALLAYAFWIKSGSKTWKRAPGPRAIPLLGHLHLMMKPGTPPHILLQSLARRYGPILSLQFGNVPIVIASNATAAKEFLKSHDTLFASRPALAAGRILAYNSDLVFATYGEQWRQLRRLASQEILCARRVEMFKSARADELKDLCDSLLKSSGQLVDVRHLLKTVAFNIITFMLMHKRYFGKNIENHEEATRFVRVIDDICVIIGSFPIGDYFPALRVVDPIEYRMKTLFKSVDEFLDARITEHERNKPKSGETMDFVDIMLNLRDKGEENLQTNTIKGFMINLLGAGTDTTAVTLEWALSEMIKHPDIMSKAREELDNVVGPNRMVNESDLPQLHYLQAVVKETFRLHPPVPLLLPHSSTQDTSVMGYDVPYNSTLIVNVYAIGRDESVWENPAEFKPERFVGSEMDFRGHDYELLPFGAGRRMCPGVNLAWITVHMTLANLVHGFEWEACVDTVSEHYGLSLIMAKKLEAVPCPRFSPHVYAAL